MRKILCLTMVCILTSVFIFASDILAVSEKSILGTQWLTTGIMRVYLVTGEFLGAAGGGSGIMSIDENMLVTGTYAITFDTTIPEPLVLGARSDFTLSETTYNAKKGLLKGTSCAVNVSYPEGGRNRSFMRACVTPRLASLLLRPSKERFLLP